MIPPDQHTLAVECAGVTWRGDRGVMRVQRAHELMMGGTVVLCEVIRFVVCGWFPLEQELLLGLSIPEPVVPHVNRFGSLLLDGVVGEPNGSGVVNSDWGGWLRETHFSQHDA